MNDPVILVQSVFSSQSFKYFICKIWNKSFSYSVIIRFKWDISVLRNLLYIIVPRKYILTAYWWRMLVARANRMRAPSTPGLAQQLKELKRSISGHTYNSSRNTHWLPTEITWRALKTTNAWISPPDLWFNLSGAQPVALRVFKCPQVIFMCI